MARKRRKPKSKLTDKQRREQALKHMASVYSGANEIPDGTTLRDYDLFELQDLSLILEDIAYDASKAHELIEELVENHPDS